MKFSVDWTENFVSSWKILLEEFKDKEVHFLEVGCFEGKATCWFLENILTHPKSDITVVDTFEGGIEHQQRNIDMNEVEQTFLNNIKGRSVKIVKGVSQIELRKLEVNQYDFAYIDGSHEASDVMEDAINCWRLIKNGGIILFDDYNRNVEKNPLLNPFPGINAFLDIFEGKYKLIFAEDQLAIRKLNY